MSRFVSILTICVLTSRLAAQAAVGMFRGDAAHSGSYARATHGDGLAGLQWRAPTGGDVVSSPTIVGHRVFVGSGDGVLYALDLETGRRQWAFDAASPIATSPAVANGRVFFGARDGVYGAVDASSGRKLWSFATAPELPWHWGHESGDHFLSSPALAGGVVVFGAGDGSIYALEQTSGKERWRAKTAGRVRSSPAIANGRVFVGSADGRVYCLNLETGAVVWTYDTEGARLESGAFGFDRRTIQSSPAVVGGTVYVGARDGFVYAIDASTGQLRWRFNHEVSWINASPAVADGVVYAGSSDGQFVQAIDAASGKELWRNNLQSLVWSSLSVAGDLVFAADFKGRLQALDRRDGRARWAFWTSARILSSPAVAGDLVVFGSDDGGVYALRMGPDSVRRVVYFDSAYTKASSVQRSHDLVASLRQRGYEPMATAALASFLTARVGDHEPSTVVFAVDVVPPEVSAAPLERSLLRRYLESGGKVVWLGIPPLMWPRDSTGARIPDLKTLDWTLPSKLLGVAEHAAIFDPRGARATDEGLRWGLPARWHDAWSVDARGISQVLGKDEWGLAAAWVRSYGGGPGTGFVRVPADSPATVYLAAEYRPSEPARRAAARHYHCSAKLLRHETARW